MSHAQDHGHFFSSRSALYPRSVSIVKRTPAGGGATVGSSGQATKHGSQRSSSSQPHPKEPASRQGSSARDKTPQHRPETSNVHNTGPQHVGADKLSWSINLPRIRTKVEPLHEHPSAGSGNQRLEHQSSFEGFRTTQNLAQGRRRQGWFSVAMSEPPSPNSQNGSPHSPPDSPQSFHSATDHLPPTAVQSHQNAPLRSAGVTVSSRQQTHRFISTPATPISAVFQPTTMFSGMYPRPSPATATAAGHPPPPDFANQPPTPAERKNIKIALVGTILGGISFANLVTNQWTSYSHTLSEDHWRDSVTAAMASKQGVNVTAPPSA